MHAYTVKLNLNSEVSQNELIQKLKTDGCEVIQTSDGICLKSQLGQSELEKSLKEKGLGRLQIEIVDGEDPELSQDIKSFLNL